MATALFRKVLNTLSNRKTLRDILRQTVYENIYSSPRTREQVTHAFLKLYADSFQTTWGNNTHWLGFRVLKCPLDLWIYQEIVYETRPDLIIECGTLDGGSALFFASICDLVGWGEVVTIDIEARGERPQHSRITYLLGSSTSNEIMQQVTQRARDKKTVLVCLDSDHTKEHVLQEMRLYSPLVTKNSYLIVEDTIVNGHPLTPEFGPGPMEAVEEFLMETDAFMADTSKEKFYASFNPRGYLKRIG